jgi:predicted NUDIX family NTP pyrophosphohydrolase
MKERDYRIETSKPITNVAPQHQEHSGDHPRPAGSVHPRWTPGFPSLCSRTLRLVKPGISAGILLFRRREGEAEVLLAHPGGPYWRQQDYGSWSVPKGIAEPDEALEAVAAREFGEETGFELGAVALDPTQPPIDLGEVTLKSGKVVHAWAVEGDLDAERAQSNEIEIEWPPRTGRRLAIPEVDRVAWFGLPEARRRAHPVQAEFVDRLEAVLRDPSGT